MLKACITVCHFSIVKIKDNHPTTPEGMTLDQNTQLGLLYYVEAEVNSPKNTSVFIQAEVDLLQSQTNITS